MLLSLLWSSSRLNKESYRVAICMSLSSSVFMYRQGRMTYIAVAKPFQIYECPICPDLLFILPFINLADQERYFKGRTGESVTDIKLFIIT